MWSHPSIAQRSSSSRETPDVFCGQTRRPAARYPQIASDGCWRAPGSGQHRAMILSGTVTLDPAAHAASTASIRARLAQLDERRRGAEQSVDRVLASWRGEAAELFRSRWEEWNSGALAVIEQLSAATDGLDQVRRDLAGTDEQSAQSAGRLTGRLG